MTPSNAEFSEHCGADLGGTWGGEEHNQNTLYKEHFFFNYKKKVKTETKKIQLEPPSFALASPNKSCRLLSSNPVRSCTCPHNYNSYIMQL